MRGRERELQIAAEFLDAAERGRGGVLLIEGEPGTGKSEILGEVINQAVKRNFSLASAMPFAPLLAALREPLGGPTGQAPRYRWSIVSGRYWNGALGPLRCS